MTENLTIGKLQCVCQTAPQSGRVVFVLYPLDTLADWVADAARRYDCSIVVVSGMDWDNDLTPWPAPGQPPGSPDFKGLASQFLSELRSGVIPAALKAMGLPEDMQTDLVGVSLSGLFALWQWVECDAFCNIACLSGSYWYAGFTQWLAGASIPPKSGRAFFCLGDQESKSPVKAFQSVAADTRSVIETLRSAGIDATFRSVPGNHFQHGIERLEMAFSFLAGQPV